MKGLEPPRLAALDPKSSASTNFATSACVWPFKTGCKYTIIFVRFLFISKLYGLPRPGFFTRKMRFPGYYLGMDTKKLFLPLFFHSQIDYN